MGNHSKSEVARLIGRLQERHNKLVEVMKGRESAAPLDEGRTPDLYVSAEDIRFAVDDLATALKEIRSRMGKG